MAKVDKNGQEKHPPTPALTPEQEAAIALLLTGATDAEVADKVGRSRQCINNWQRVHPGFIAELNRRRANMWQGCADKMRGLVVTSLQVMEQALQSADHGFKAAQTILKSVTLPVAAFGAQDAEEILMERAKKAKDDEFASWGSGLSWHKDQLRAQLQEEEDAD